MVQKFKIQYLILSKNLKVPEIQRTEKEQIFETFRFPLSQARMCDEQAPEIVRNPKIIPNKKTGI